MPKIAYKYLSTIFQAKTLKNGYMQNISLKIMVMTVAPIKITLHSTEWAATYANIKTVTFNNIPHLLTQDQQMNKTFQYSYTFYNHNPLLVNNNGKHLTPSSHLVCVLINLKLVTPELKHNVSFQLVAPGYEVLRQIGPSKPI